MALAERVVISPISTRGLEPQPQPTEQGTAIILHPKFHSGTVFSTEKMHGPTGADTEHAGNLQRLARKLGMLDENIRGTGEEPGPGVRKVLLSEVRDLCQEVGLPFSEQPLQEFYRDYWESVGVQPRERATKPTEVMSSVVYKKR